MSANARYKVNITNKPNLALVVMTSGRKALTCRYFSTEYIIYFLKLWHMTVNKSEVPRKALDKIMKWYFGYDNPFLVRATINTFKF